MIAFPPARSCPWRRPKVSTWVARETFGRPEGHGQETIGIYTSRGLYRSSEADAAHEEVKRQHPGLLQRAFHFRALAASARAAKDLRAALDERKEELEEESRQNVKVLKKKASRASEDARQRLERLDAQRARIAEVGQEPIRALREKAAAAMLRERKAAEARAGELGEQIARFVAPKPKAAHASFPAYRKAKAQGFKHGTEPSDSEVNELVQAAITEFHESLDMFSQMILNKLIESLPSDKVNEIVAVLMSLPPSERNARLRSLIGM